MDVIQTRWGWRRPLILGLTALAVVGTSACGDSDDEPAATGTTSTTATTTSETSREEAKAPRTGKDRKTSDGAPAESNAAPPTTPGGEEERVADSVRSMYRALASSDASAVCAAMTEQAREQIAQQPPGGATPPPGDGDCVDSLSRFLGAAASSGVLEQTLKATVTGVEVTGPRALATVSFGGRSGKIRLVKEDGQWRFGAPPSATGTP